MIYDKQFTLNNYYGEEIQLISHLNGKQTYIFYTIRQSKQNKVGLLEVLINEKLNDNEQLVIDYGELTVPRADDSMNFGLIHLGGGDGKLLTFSDSFTKIKGYTMCSYNEMVSEYGSNVCSSLVASKNKYSLDPFTIEATSCGKSQNNSIKEQKLNFICKMEKAEVNLPRIIVISVMIASTIFCFVSTSLFCKNK